MTPDADADLSLDAAWTVRILTRFLQVESRRAGLPRLVVGLSGGLDSAVATYLAARALGPEAVLCLRLPYRTSSADSLADAQSVVDALGTPCETVDITPIADGFSQCSGEVDRLRLGNALSRTRMLVLYDRSARQRGLVLGTSNKTELLLGYGTLHGDLASALNPLGDLYKTQVRRLAEYLEVPEAIRRKPPSADLWPEQSDELDLGLTYDEVDRVLALLVDARVGVDRVVAAGHAPELVERVSRMIERSQFKRRPPVIAKVSTRTIGWDFRYPRDWRT